jgi:hypothetical protein
MIEVFGNVAGNSNDSGSRGGIGARFHDRRRAYDGDRPLARRPRELPYIDAASLTSTIPLRGVDFVYRLRRADGETFRPTGAWWIV